MLRRRSLLGDRNYDGKYIAAEHAHGTKVYKVPKLIAELKRAVTCMTGIHADEIELDADYFEDLGLEEEDIEDLADECSDRFLPGYAPITDTESSGWKTPYDTAVSVMGCMGANARRFEVPSCMKPRRHRS